MIFAHSISLENGLDIIAPKRVSLGGATGIQFLEVPITVYVRFDDSGDRIKISEPRSLYFCNRRISWIHIDSEGVTSEAEFKFLVFTQGESMSAGQPSSSVPPRLLSWLVPNGHGATTNSNVADIAPALRGAGTAGPGSGAVVAATLVNGGTSNNQWIAALSGTYMQLHAAASGVINGSARLLTAADVTFLMAAIRGDWRGPDFTLRLQTRVRGITNGTLDNGAGVAEQGGLFGWTEALAEFTRPADGIMWRTNGLLGTNWFANVTYQIATDDAVVAVNVNTGVPIATDFLSELVLRVVRGVTTIEWKADGDVVHSSGPIAGWQSTDDDNDSGFYPAFGACAWRRRINDSNFKLQFGGHGGVKCELSGEILEALG